MVARHVLAASVFFAVACLSPSPTKGQVVHIRNRVALPVTASELVGMSLFDDSAGIVFTHFRVWSTSDGGRKWREVHVPPLPGLPGVPNMITNAAFFSRNVAWVGAVGTPMTQDGGRSWITTMSSERPTAVADVFCLPSGSACWAVGSETVGSQRRPPDLLVLKTSDLGGQWQTQRLPGALRDRGLWSVHFFDESRGLAIGSPDIYYTQNGGALWSFASFRADCLDPETARGSRDIRSWAFRGPSTAWVSLEGGSVLRTTDGGATFCQVGKSVETGFSQMFFTSESVGWARDRWGAIYNTRSAGESWVRLTTPLPLRSLSVGGNGSAWGLSAKALYRIELIP